MPSTRCLQRSHVTLTVLIADLEKLLVDIKLRFFQWSHRVSTNFGVLVDEAIAESRDRLRDNCRQRSGQLRRAAATWSRVAADYLNTRKALIYEQYRHRSCGTLKWCRGREVQRGVTKVRAPMPQPEYKLSTVCAGSLKELSRSPVNRRELKAGIRGGNIA